MLRNERALRHGRVLVVVARLLSLAGQAAHILVVSELGVRVQLCHEGGG